MQQFRSLFKQFIAPQQTATKANKIHSVVHIRYLIIQRDALAQILIHINNIATPSKFQSNHTN